MDNISLHLSRLLALSLALSLAGCGDDGVDAELPDATTPSVLGEIRVVHPGLVSDSSLWGLEIELALEAEFWDTIVNSDHEHYPSWQAKVDDYIDRNPDASDRMVLLATAGGVFQISQAFTESGVDQTILLANLGAVIEGAEFILDSTQLATHVPAHVFANNNLGMRGLLLGPIDEGLDHLEALLVLEGSEGRAAAPFTYAMINDDTALQYAIDLNENCDNFVCMWTSQLAPAKPIGQLMMLAELYAMDGDFVSMGATLDRAETLATERQWPFMSRIDELRTALPMRTYEDGASVGLDGIRWPMPYYSNEVNCSNCHVGALAGQSGIDLTNPYTGYDVLTPAPSPPDLSHLLPLP